ncbi:MAG: hypothetical protein B7Y49_02065 [Sphingomonas sp. 28-62-11]|nr:MAG: hypothetical protein B7Y49_02065 [Sphingomonas sp. 28-62-11]
MIEDGSEEGIATLVTGEQGALPDSGTTGCTGDRTGQVRKGQAKAMALARIATLRGRLDGGELKLRRGIRGEFDRQHACRLAGISRTTLAKHLEVKNALEGAAEGRTLDDPPPRAPCTRKSASRMMQRLANLDRRLRLDMRAHAGPDGQIARKTLARMAGLPDGWQDVRSVTAALDRMAAEHAPPPAAEVGEEAALAALDAYDIRLLVDRGRVPSLFGQPSAALAEPGTGVSAHEISRSDALQARFVAIARRHGLRQPASTWKRDTVVTAAMRELRDAFDTHALRGTAFPTLPSGMLDHQALLEQLGLSGELVVQNAVRTRASSLHRELHVANGGTKLDANECLLNDVTAVVDRYELHVLAGVQGVPRGASGEVDLPCVEHLYQLTAGTMKRFPDLARRVLAIGPRGDAVRVADARARLLETIVSALAGHASSLAAARRGVRVDHGNHASHAALERALCLRAGSIAAFEEARRAVEDMTAELGKQPTRRERHNDELDPLVDAYVRHINERGFGWPRLSETSGHMSAAGVAAEITQLTGRHVSPGRIDKYWMDRIRDRCRPIPQLGPVHVPATAKGSRDGNERSLAVLGRYLASCKEGLPGDPLQEGHVDLSVVAERTLIDVLTLTKTPAYLACIDEWRIRLGIKPYASGAIGVSIEDLIAEGRERRAKDTRSAQPGQAVARSVRALLDAMAAAGLSLADDAGAIPELAVGAPVATVVGSELGRWREYLGEMRRERMLADGLARSLKIMLRASGMTWNELQHRIEERSNRKLGTETVKSWTLGLREPTFAQQFAIDIAEEVFELTPGSLTRKMCADSRVRGVYELAPDGIPIPRGYDAHLPIGYERLTREQQRSLLNNVADRVISQDTVYARRQRVLVLDEYRLRREDWPKHLKEEWRAYRLTRLPKDVMEIGADLGDTDQDDKTKPLGSGGEDRLLNVLESFFGFLTRPPKIKTPPPSVSELTPEWRREHAEAAARSVGYTPEPGLGILPKHLSLGLIAVRDLYRGWVKFRANRSGDESSETLLAVNLFHNFVKEGGYVRNQGDMPARVRAMLAWWDKEQDGDVRRTYKLRGVASGAKGWTALCDHAGELYALHYGKLLDRRAARNNQPRLTKRRDPFASVRKLLKSKHPLRYYRKAIQRMVNAKPTQIRLRHTWLRNCVLALILFQTLLRVKNLARLTYRADGTGQLRRENGKWVVQIHKDNFKNKHGKYFIGGDYFRMTLRNEDGLYDLLDQYLGTTREHFLGEADGASGEDAALEAVPEEAVYFDDLDDFDDGAADEDRFFLTEGGTPFTASLLAHCYYKMTKRHFVHNRHRRRGIRGFMPHGPHSVRHVGATAVLKKGGSYADAGRVIQDSEETARRDYVEFGPQDNGQRAGQLLADCS